MKKFEYKTILIGINTNIESLDAHINKMGLEGWEMVSAFDVAKGSGVNAWSNEAFTSGFILIFKRELDA
jgi:hypothetical protein